MRHFTDTLFEDLAMTAIPDETTYYRIEVFDDMNKNQGGLFRGLKVLLDQLWEADDEKYDYINEPLSWLEYKTPYPDNLDNPKIKFAYKHSFYNKYIDFFKDIEAELNAVSWSMSTNKLSRPEKIVYEDNVQIAYI